MPETGPDPADKQILEAAVLNDANSLAAGGRRGHQRNLFPRCRMRPRGAVAETGTGAAAAEPETLPPPPVDEIDFARFRRLPRSRLQERRPESVESLRSRPSCPRPYPGRLLARAIEPSA